MAKIRLPRKVKKQYKKIKLDWVDLDFFPDLTIEPIENLKNYQY